MTLNEYVRKWNVELIFYGGNDNWVVNINGEWEFELYDYKDDTQEPTMEKAITIAKKMGIGWDRIEYQEWFTDLEKIIF